MSRSGYCSVPPAPVGTLLTSTCKPYNASNHCNGITVAFDEDAKPPTNETVVGHSESRKWKLALGISIILISLQGTLIVWLTLRKEQNSFPSPLNLSSIAQFSMSGIFQQKFASPCLSENSSRDAEETSSEQAENHKLPVQTSHAGLLSCWRIKSHFNIWANHQHTSNAPDEAVNARPYQSDLKPNFPGHSQEQSDTYFAVRDCVEVNDNENFGSQKSFYWRLEHRLSWAEARRACAFVPNAHLASVHNFREKQLIYDLTLNNFYASAGGRLSSAAGVWIGLYSKHESPSVRSAYHWADRSPVDYSDWLQSEGEQHPVEDSKHGSCVKVVHALFSAAGELSAGWDNANCELQLKAICKHSERPN